MANDYGPQTTSTVISGHDESCSYCFRPGALASRAFGPPARRNCVDMIVTLFGGRRMPFDRRSDRLDARAAASITHSTDETRPAVLAITQLGDSGHRRCWRRGSSAQDTV